MLIFLHDHLIYNLISIYTLLIRIFEANGTHDEHGEIYYLGFIGSPVVENKNSIIHNIYIYITLRYVQIISSINGS